jgi:catechol 2,3-dioxygenase-like lactoylglutathione lyase family enzyme
VLISLCNVYSLLVLGSKHMSDLGLTHVALPVQDINKSIAFYVKYAGMQPVHKRIDEGSQAAVAWLSDLTRPFVIVLIQVPRVEHPLAAIAHLGVALESVAAVDRLCDEARLEGVLLDGPQDGGSTIGYWAFLKDPDGHTLEISYGQEIGFTVEHAASVQI